MVVTYLKVTLVTCELIRKCVCLYVSVVSVWIGRSEITVFTHQIFLLMSIHVSFQVKSLWECSLTDHTLITLA